MAKKWLFGFALAVAGGASTLGLYKLIGEQPQTVTVIQEQPESGYTFVNDKTLPGNLVDFRPAVKNSLDAVVHIKTNTTVTYYDPFRELFYGKGANKQHLQASGSGVIISQDGYIVTNNHVVKDADDIEISLNDKRSYKAEVIGTDPGTDLALLKIADKELPHIAYGNSDKVEVGEWVVAVGNPYNLTSTVTAGIVSAKGRDINIIGNSTGALESFIQTDAVVNPGNSGGALVDVEGNLVGINTAIKSNTGSYTGYSFAVPVNLVKKVVRDLLEFGSVQRGYIGVSIRDIDKNLADAEDIPVLNGAYVQATLEEGAADAAGIQRGDVITKIGTHPITSVTELQEKVGQFRPGDKINVTVLREGKEMSIPVTLKNMEGTTKLAKLDHTELYKKIGAKLEVLTDRDMEARNVKSGLKVTEVWPGKFRSVGIQEGFIITKVDHKPINSTEEFANIVGNKKGGVLIEGVYPNGKVAYYGFGL